MREVQQQLTFYLKTLEGEDAYKALHTQGKNLEEKLREWEEKLIQPKQKTFQDVINFNNQLNAEFMHLKGYVDEADPTVTQGALDRFADLKKEWEANAADLKSLIETDMDAFNKEYHALAIPVLQLPKTL